MAASLADALSWQIMLWTGLTIVIVGAVLKGIMKHFFKSQGNSRIPPLYSGWIPWLGCAVDFGRAPLYFIDEKRRKLGPVFTLKVAGERLTFLMDPTDFHLLFQSPNVDFQKAVQTPVQNVASITEASFFTYHTKIHDTVKGKLAANKLSSIFPKLQQSFAEGLDSIKSKEKCELHQLVRNVMYRGIIDNLFGKNTLPTIDKEAFEELVQHFTKFDEQFEYGSKIPQMFLREWTQSKVWLLKLFTKVVNQLASGTAEEENTVLQSLLAVVDAEHSPNYSLLLLWASLANAVPITFWTLAFMLAHEHAWKKAKDDVAAVLGSGKEVTEDQLLKTPYLRWCIMEAIRLRSPGVVARRVIKPFTVKNYTIPAGDMVMVSPYWAHRNPKYFPDPDKFLPERWQSADLEKNIFLDGFIAFGGGRYQCPGRWFALMELHLFVAQFLQRFDCQLLSTVPELSPLHVVGTQQPTGPCHVKLTRL
ncbi:24-hydroxycholesterol 7-alpha-hydroxylase-like isoform X1 [Pomacea canaliculata]|uniref:24-hydroxycholesterol 7-alpha-hydroxylase-like isoform X1 n=2 Tax=Pomacea canaliculata TaxID=400727 RepID=UPI000D7395FC|nr:24-hydroxycholesterol 7-alpha-hydroxylase-like isoform X1 [Pomacea canaliculata]XP_025078739.1 24-hydroxycholesterol 7-alpha-hydroxylase-like isoform X1 [Pomacea canaliculata]XP_025078740.1 24-hydroxycholesterol 7-alpha-hydroxylase-like isoform X1 [Pomacea canaliculata]